MKLENSCIGKRVVVNPLYDDPRGYFKPFSGTITGVNLDTFQIEDDDGDESEVDPEQAEEIIQ